MRRLYRQFTTTNFEAAFVADRLRLATVIVFEILCMAVVVFIQYYWRQVYTPTTPWQVFLLGSLPSYLGAAGYVALAFALYKMVLWHHGLYTLRKALIGSFWVPVLGLIIWECIRTVLYPFDWNDVAMTIAGALTTVLLIAVLYRREK